MKENFQLYSKYYDLFYKNKDYKTEVKYIKDCILEHSPNAQTILEFGSGTGGHGLILQKEGFEVFGLERSKEMVEIATQNNFPCMQTDIVEFDLEKNFDIIISIFHVISYITDNNSLLEVFNNASKHLNSGGLFIFDVWYSPAVYFQKPETRIKRFDDDEISIIRIAEPLIHTNKNMVDVNYSIIIKDNISEKSTIFNETHPMRHFTIPEIELLAKICGFKTVRTEEFLTKNEPSIDTWGVCFILEKI